MTPTEAAEFLRLAPKTLEQRRNKKLGPPFYRISHRCVRYSQEDILAWLRQSNPDYTIHWGRNRGGGKV